MSPTRIEEQLKKQGYTLGDALTIGSSNYETPYLWLGIGAFMAACGGALTDSFLLLWFGMGGVGMAVIARLQIAVRPTLYLEAEGIRRGETLIPWVDIQGCERVTTLRRVFIEFTFVDAERRVQSERSRVAPALYRQLIDSADAKPDASPEPVDEAPRELANQPAYRSAPQPTSKAPPTPWWRALVRLVSGKK